MILGYIIRLKVKEIEIWNLSKVILSKFNFFIHCFGCNFNSAKKKLFNEIMIISNREVLNYGQRDSTNGKNIINFMINKERKEKPRQAKKTSVSLILKSFKFYCYLDAYITMPEPSAIILSMLLEHWTQLSKIPHLTRTSLYNRYTGNVRGRSDRPLTFSQMQQSCPDET